ncbi:MAG TPA: glycerophosphodiester phosphodiesterase family protein [Spirochaetota bacterium]|nr:glycerophosphodiester phosphodiesterase family protein [Spirochaetota bacterium]HPI91247.1 glycerophosphodiester phosphodiesterase family protein [Spirochaetota bacterium]HPR49957.1 glycerophosphodiester phosphodiesterase family protein [Spirochaetota bacterium]
MSDVLKIAHRGYSEKYPENTMPAFKAALDAGADMIELDVHLSRDRKLVVIHDETIDRTSNGSGRVGDMSLAELRKFDYRHTFREKGPCDIPLLEDVIELVKGRAGLNIEIKNLPSHYRGIEEILAGTLKKTGFLDDALVSSFDHFSLEEIKRVEPAVKTGMLYDSLWLSFNREVDILGCFSVHPSIDSFYPEQARWAREHGMKVFPWVAKDRETLNMLVGSGLVDGVMVNDLDLFAK